MPHTSGIQVSRITKVKSIERGPLLGVQGVEEK
jgi:hypothetical protein